MRRAGLLLGSIAVAVGVTVVAGAGPRAAQAAEGPSAAPKPPPFEEALAAAKKAGKPLVIDFGAEWCEPCKLMEAELAKPHGQAALAGVHFVRYDVDVQPGTAVKDRFNISSYPTVMALDPEGKEVDRQVGYGEFAPLRAWLEKVPERATSLPECLARADADRKNASLQLLAGRRLVKARRPAEARRYLARAASAAPDDKLAAQASWALADAEVDAQALPVRRRHAERVAARYPTTPEGLRAFRFLATLPRPPRELVARVVDGHLAATRAPDAATLEDLVLYALRAGALDAAGKAAARLEPLAAKDGRRLGVVAEAAHLQGDGARAVALGERAVAAATGSARTTLEKDLERFRRGDKEPGLALAALTPEGDDGRRSESTRQTPAWISAAPKLTRKMVEDCAPTGAPVGELTIQVLSGPKPEDLRLVPERPIPAELGRCLEKAAQAVGVPPDQTFSLQPTLDPPWFAQGLSLARRTAADCLPPAAAGDRLEPVRVVLSNLDGTERLTIAGGRAELARCLERAFWFVRLPAGSTRTVPVIPARPKRPEDKDKPLTAQEAPR